MNSPRQIYVPLLDRNSVQIHTAKEVNITATCRPMPKSHGMFLFSHYFTLWHFHFSPVNEEQNDDDDEDAMLINSSVKV